MMDKPRIKRTPSGKWSCATRLSGETGSTPAGAYLNWIMAERGAGYIPYDKGVEWIRRAIAAQHHDLRRTA